MAILYDKDESLRERVDKCLEDNFKHNAIEIAQETFYNKRKQLVEEMPDWEGLRQSAIEIRNEVTRNLDFYVKEFAENAQAHGCTMHYAPTADDALWEILEVLEKAGVNVIETDCAEAILQTAKSAPSHIVVPALHFDREKIAEIFRNERGYDGDAVPEHITHFLRKIMREEFLSSEVGIRGCNFAVADTGSVTLVTNEGNGRMVDSFPKVQVVVVGIDRIVPDLESLDVMMALLPRSAVGAKMTAYFTIDQGPAHPGESDGPEEVHVVIMDNGRSSLVGTEFEDMLRCCRCGACLNICPVYRHITGHGYGSIYPGPMGIVLTAALEGYDNVDDLAYACSLCGACTDHCPVHIPLHDLIRDHRINMVEQGKNHKAEVPLFKGAELMWTNLPVYRMAMKAGRPVMQALSKGEEIDGLGAKSAWIPVLKGWTSSRDMDVLSETRFRDWFEQHKAQREEASKTEGGDR